METATLISPKVTNETLKTIYERRAIRKYTDKKVSKEIIDQLLDAGRMAPSAINKQPWKFYVTTDENTISLFSKEIVKAAAAHYHLSLFTGLVRSKDIIFHGAPSIIFITYPVKNEWAPLDIGMCSQNIMLAAKSLGLDTCPVGMGKFIEDTPAYSMLGIHKSEKVALAIIVGYGDEKPELHKRKTDNVVYIK